MDTFNYRFNSFNKNKPPHQIHRNGVFYTGFETYTEALGFLMAAELEAIEQQQAAEAAEAAKLKAQKAWQALPDFARIAYEAMLSSRRMGMASSRPLPTWQRLGSLGRGRWRTVANEVIDAYKKYHTS